MIRRDPKHWFECLYPTLEKKDKEIFFKHPFEDIKCNQLGVLYYDEERYVAYDSRTGSVVREHLAWNGKAVRVLGSRSKVVWECYHQEKLESGSHFIFMNCNTLDWSMENLLILSKLDANTKSEVTKARSEFIKNTVEHLVKLEAKYEKRGIEQKQLHDLLQIPNWLSGARSRYKGAKYAKKV